MHATLTLSPEFEPLRIALRDRIDAWLSRFRGRLQKVSIDLRTHESGQQARRPSDRRCVARIRASAGARRIEHVHFGWNPEDAIDSVLSRLSRTLDRERARELLVAPPMSLRARRGTVGSARSPSDRERGAE